MPEGEHLSVAPNDMVRRFPHTMYEIFQLRPWEWHPYFEVEGGGDLEPSAPGEGATVREGRSVEVGR